MATLPLRYILELAGALIPLRDVRGEERLSTPFRFEMRFLLPEGHDIDPDQAMKQPAILWLDRDGPLRRIDGLITEVIVEATVRGTPEVRLWLEPRLSLARHRKDVRLFRDRTVPEIVTEVLSTIGITPELRLRQTYARRPYCVQFRETDLDFVHRLLEDEGIFYFFLEGDVLVLADDRAAYEEGHTLTIPFRAAGGVDQGEEAVIAMEHRASMGPGMVSLRDFNPDHPSLSMDVSAPGPTPSGPEFYDYPGEYLEPSEGARKAKLMGEAMAISAAFHAGRTYSPRFAPGRVFQLVDAPLGVLPGEYAITKVLHDFAAHSGGFSLAFEAIEAEITFRPPRITPAPTLSNPLTGIVTGPAGEDIHTDALGRVKVHFHWDRLFPRHDNCSDWIPVLQDNTGHSSAIPRVGWEVLVHFLEGDPDRPVVLGRVYNGEDPFPAGLPQNKTQSALKSLSSPGRGGTNEIQLEDAAGREQVLVHAERDQNIVIGNDKRQDVLSNENSVIGRDEMIQIGVNHTALVGKDHTGTIGGDHTLSVSGKRSRSVSGDETSAVEGNRRLQISGMHFRRIGTDDIVKANKLSEQVGGVILETHLKTNTTIATKAMTLTVGGAMVELARKDKSESIGGVRVETIGAAVLTKATGAFKLGVKKARKSRVGGALFMGARKKLVVRAKEKVSAKAAIASLSGTTSVMLKVGESVVLLSEGLVKLHAPSTIMLKVTGPSDLGASKSDQD